MSVCSERMDIEGITSMTKYTASATLPQDGGDLAACVRGRVLLGTVVVRWSRSGVERSVSQ